MITASMQMHPDATVYLDDDAAATEDARLLRLVKEKKPTRVQCAGETPLAQRSRIRVFALLRTRRRHGQSFLAGCAGPAARISQLGGEQSDDRDGDQGAQPPKTTERIGPTRRRSGRFHAAQFIR
jgi:hypothetical protein